MGPRYTTRVPRRTSSRSLRPWSLLGTLGLAVGLLAAYRFLVAPSFDYLGYTWVSPDVGILGLSLLELLALALLLPTRIDHPSDFMLWIIFTTVIIPVTMIANVIGLLSATQIVLLCFWVGVAFAIAVLMARWGQGRLTWRIPRLPPVIFWTGLWGFIIASMVLLVMVNGLRLNFTGLLDVYDLREEYADNLTSLPLLGYMIPTLSYIAIPFVIVRGLHRHSLLLVSVGVGAQLFMYAQTGFKTFLFGIPVILLLALMIGRRVSTAILPGALAFGMLGAAVADIVTNNILFSSLFTRRFLATPGQLAANYIDFFSEHRFVFLSEGLWRPWVNYPYDLPVPFMIGREIHGVATNSSNVNFYGDGFAQGGWLGLMVAGLVFGVVLMLIDWAAQDLPVSVACMLMFLPCIVLGNASILTSMLSHGLAAGIAVLALAPRQGWRPRPKPARRDNLVLAHGWG